MPSSSKDITFEDLAKYFHLPINQVAKELGICATILKKICRKNGIPRWPHRKIKSLDKRLAYLEENLKKDSHSSEAEAEILHLQRKKTEILKNPAVLVAKNLGLNVYSLKPVQTSSLAKPTTMINTTKLQQDIQSNTYPKTHEYENHPQTLPPLHIPNSIPKSPLGFPQVLPLDAQPKQDSVFFDFIMRANTVPPPQLMPHHHAYPAPPHTRQPSSSIQLPPPVSYPVTSQTNANSPHELPSFKILFDVVEGERALLESQDPSPVSQSPSLRFPPVTSGALSSPFPDWYFEEKNRVLKLNNSNNY